MSEAYEYHIPLGKRGPIMLAEGDAHQWLTMAVFGVTEAGVRRIVGEMERGADPTESLDHENLITVQGPGCFKCNQPLTPETARTRCPVIVRTTHVEGCQC